MSSQVLGNGPTVNITSHSDGDWVPEPGVVVSGRIEPQRGSQYQDITSLGSVDLVNLAIENDLLVLHLSQPFNDDFDGSALDTLLWDIAYPNRWIYVQNGLLLLYPRYSSNNWYFPLITSKGDVFPQEEAVGWEVVFSLRYPSEPSNELGGGVTGSLVDLDQCHMAVYKRVGDPKEIMVFSEGDIVYANGTALTVWHTFTLRYDAVSAEYTILVDGKLNSNFKTDDPCGLIWFGSTLDMLYGSYSYQGPLTVDYVSLWVNSGTWTSEVQDMGRVVTFDTFEVAYNTSHPAKARTDLLVRCSPDGWTWTDWTRVVDGELPEPLLGRYYQYRLTLAIPGAASTRARIRVDGVTAGYHHTLSDVAYERNGEGWHSLPAQEEFSISMDLLEDENLIRVRAVDVRGLIDVASVTIILDSTPPVGSLIINEGAPWTNDMNLSLDLPAFDAWGVEWMEISHDPEMIVWRRYQYSATRVHPIPWSDGLVTVRARFIDSHGWVSTMVMDTINADPIPPMVSVLVEDGALYAATTTVDVQLTYSDNYGISSVALSNHEDLRDAVELDVGTARTTWDLATSVDGPVTVYAAITDLAGNVAIGRDTIQLYLPKAVGSVVVEGGCEVVSNNIVCLEITAPTELRAVQMQVSNTEDFTGVDWETYAEELLWFLTGDDGEKEVFVRFLDFRGIVSLPIRGSILLDTTPPDVEVELNNGTKFTTKNRVQVVIDYSDANPAGSMWVSLEADFKDAEPRDFSSLFVLDVPSVDGLQTVHVRVEDAVGNLAQVSDSIYLAKHKPSISLAIDGGSPSSAGQAVGVLVEWNDVYGPVEVQLAFDRYPGDEDPWMPLNGPLELAIPAGTADGTYQVWGIARNLPGLRSDPVKTTLELDRTPPGLEVSRPRDGSTLRQGDCKVKVVMQYGDPSGIASLGYRINGGAWIPLEPSGEDAVLEFPGFGTHKLEVRAVDDAGNEAIASTAILLANNEEEGTSTATLVLLVLGIVTAALLVTLVLLRFRPWDRHPP